MLQPWSLILPPSVLFYPTPAVLPVGVAASSSLPEQTEDGKFRHALLGALLEAEVEDGRNVAVMEDFLADLNDRVQTLSRRKGNDRKHDGS